MIDKIVSFSVRNKLIVALFTLGIIIWGSYEVSQLPFDALPDITDNQVQIITVSPALGAGDIERLVTMPVEYSLQTIQGIKQIRSFSRFGLSLVTVVFEDNVDIYWARQQISEKINQVKNEIPENAGIPEMAPITTGLGEIYQYVVKAKPGFEHQYGPMELRTIQDWTIRKQLLGTPGVADVSSFGGYLKQYAVVVRPDDLTRLQISLQEIIDVVQKNNQNTGGSYIEKNNQALFIRTEGLIGTPEDIENIVVRHQDNNSMIRIKDVADVQLDHAKRYGAMCYNNDGEVSGAVVMMVKGANSVAVIDAVKTRMEKIQSQLPEGVELEAFLDRSKMVGHALSTVETNLLEGALIVLFVLIVFLGQWRAGILVASVIPLAMLIAVGLMNLFGVNGNLMSLGALDFGLIVDGAVIVVEGVLHHIHQNKTNHHSKDDITISSTSQIMKSAVFGQFIILIVYIPILSLSGIEGKMFIPMAQTISFAIVGAFILSITYVPMMSALVLSVKGNKSDNWSDRMIHRVQTRYHLLLLKAKNKFRPIMLTAIGLFVISVVLLLNMGGEFIPELEEGDFAVETRTLTGTHLNTTIEASQKAVSILMNEYPEIQKVVTKIGSSEIPTDPMPMEACDMIIVLKDKKEWTHADNFDDLATAMGKSLEKLPGVTTGFQYPVQMRFNELMTGARQDIVCKIYGDNLDTLSKYGEKLGELARLIPGAQDIYVESMIGMPQVLVQYNRAKMSMYDMNVAEANQTIQAALAGAAAGSVYENERKFTITIKLDPKQLTDLGMIQDLLLDSPLHGKVPLKDVASVQWVNGVNQIQREKAQRRIIVGFNVRDRDIESTVLDLKEKVGTDLQLPNLYHVEYGGTFENLEAAKSRLSIAVPASLLMIFLLLYFAFGSLSQGLLIFSAIPLAAIGGIFALTITGMPFSISAGIGFIALFGVAVLNGIVLMAEFQRLEKETELTAWEIVMEGTKNRIRPVLMTATAASLGFLPMALSQGAGAEVQRPLAVVVIGGILTATLLTLFVLPLLYFNKSQGKTKKTLGNVKTPTAVLLFLVFSTNALQSQTTWNDCLALARKSYFQQNHQLRKEQAKINSERPALDSPLEFNTEFGHVNSMAWDRRVTLGQQLSLPNVYHSLKQWQQSNGAITLLENDLTYHQFLNQVKEKFLLIVFLQEYQNDMRKIDSLQSLALNTAKIQLDNGWIDAAEFFAIQQQKTNLDGNAQAIQQLILQYHNDLEKSIDQSISLPLISESNPLSVEETDVQKSGWLQLENEQLRLTQLQLQQAKYSRLPQMRWGLSAMTIIGYQNFNNQDYYWDQSKWFGTFSLGLAIPIPNGISKNRIQSARLQLKIQENIQAQWKWELQQEMAFLLESQKRHQLELDKLLHQESAWIQPAFNVWMIKLKNGESDFLQWSQNQNQWREFYDLLLQKKIALLENQIQISNLIGHE